MPKIDSRTGLLRAGNYQDTCFAFGEEAGIYSCWRLCCFYI